MATEYLFADEATGLWAVDESTGVATHLLTYTSTLYTGVVNGEGEAFFSVPNATTGAPTELWVTTGSTAGSSLVTTLPDNTSSGTDTAGIYDLTSLGNGEVAFSYFDGQQWTVYLSDGTADGTVPISNYDSAAGQPLLDPGQTAELNGSLLFENTVTGLWSVNETTGVATHLETFTTTTDASVAVSDGKAYFNEHDPNTTTNSTTQIWVTDGGAGVATLVDSLPQGDTAVGDYQILSGITALSNGEVLFDYNASGGSAYSGLYLTSGTSASTVAVSGYTPSESAIYGFGSFAELAGKVIFQDIDSGLWAFDETTGHATNIMAYQFNNDAALSNIVTAGSLAYFSLSPSGVGGANLQLWSTDGTSGGTHLIVSLPDNSSPDDDNLSGIGDITSLSNGDVTFFYYDGATTSVYLGNTDGVQLLSGYPTGGSPLIYQDEIAELSCFVEGTLIATETGPRAVEILAVGDRLITRDSPRAITWLGHRHVACDTHPRPRDVWPIRIVRDAFGPGAPVRDLFLSPDHAVFLDGALIPIRHLVNGQTIMQTPRDAVTYWHVELARHEVIFAEGLATESYLDTGARHAFDGVWRRRPASATLQDANCLVWEAAGYAPLVVAGAAIDKAHTTLHRQAQYLDAAA